MKRSTSSMAAMALVGALALPASPSGEMPERAPLGDAPDAAAMTVPANSVVEVPVAGVAGVGAEVAGVVLNVTAVDAERAGFVTVWPCGESRPVASNLNFVPAGAGHGSAVANSVVVGVGAGESGVGSVCLFSDASVELVVDVGGWFPVGSEFRPVQPARLLDTRSSADEVGVPGGTGGGPGAGGSGGAGGGGSGGGDAGGGPEFGGEVEFAETFSGGHGLDRFETGVFHRDPGGAGSSWQADHDRYHPSGDCGAPTDHQHTVSKGDGADGAIFVCRDHMMTTMGEVDFYSIVWFSPDAVFSGPDHVAWDVNVTDLGDRQWVEVAIQPADSPRLTCADGLPCDLPGYDPDAVVVGIGGPWGSGIKVNGEGVTWQPLCGGEYALDPEGCASKSIRRPFSITDNGNGTMTVRFQGQSWEVAGSFPDEPWVVVFKDHNYTPDKSCPSGGCTGYTWHWDNVVIGRR